MDQEDSSSFKLTPEQQRQLELIERMPLVVETEAANSQEDWETKNLEEKERLYGESGDLISFFSL